MTTNFYKFKAQLEKMYLEGVSDAEAKLRANQADKMYYGDEFVAKIRTSQGSEIYYLKDTVFNEIIRLFSVINEVSTMVYGWENITGTPKTLSRKEIQFSYFIKGLKINDVYESSMKKCYKGSPMMDFYKNPAEVEHQNLVEKMKSDVIEKWHF